MFGAREGVAICGFSGIGDEGIMGEASLTFCGDLTREASGEGMVAEFSTD